MTLTKLAQQLLTSNAAKSQEADATQVKPIPSTPQKDKFSCGAAAVQAVAQYFGHWTRQEDLAKALGTNKDTGTDPIAMTKYLRSIGLRAEITVNMCIYDLQSLAKQKNTAVIVNFQAWGKKKDYANEWQDGHYATLAAIDSSNIYLRDPSIIGSIGVLTIDDFLTRWHDQDKTRKYHRMAIVVHGQANQPDTYTPIE